MTTPNAKPAETTKARDRTPVSPICFHIYSNSKGIREAAAISLKKRPTAPTKSRIPITVTGFW